MSLPRAPMTTVLRLPQLFSGSKGQVGDRQSTVMQRGETDVLTSIGKVPVYVRHADHAMGTKVGDFAPSDVNIIVGLFETHDWHLEGERGGSDVLGTQWVINYDKQKTWFEIIIEGGS